MESQEILSSGGGGGWYIKVSKLGFLSKIPFTDKKNWQGNWEF